jgi:hypothetical protein
MPQIDFRPVNRVRSDCNWLLNWRSDVTSQIGQDGILEKVFSLIGDGKKFCVEFGAWDGKFLSNTWNLIVNKRWNGVLIEGNPEKFKQLTSNHADSDVKAIRGMSACKVRTLWTIFWINAERPPIPTWSRSMSMEMIGTYGSR